MKYETIVMYFVALLLGLLLANMIESVCGCDRNVVEGHADESVHDIIARMGEGGLVSSDGIVHTHDNNPKYYHPTGAGTHECVGVTEWAGVGGCAGIPEKWSAQIREEYDAADNGEHDCLAGTPGDNFVDKQVPSCAEAGRTKSGANCDEVLGGVGQNPEVQMPARPILPSCEDLSSDVCNTKKKVSDCSTIGVRLRSRSDTGICPGRGAVSDDIASGEGNSCADLSSRGTLDAADIINLLSLKTELSEEDFTKYALRKREETGSDFCGKYYETSGISGTLTECISNPTAVTTGTDTEWFRRDKLNLARSSLHGEGESAAVRSLRQAYEDMYGWEVPCMAAAIPPDTNPCPTQSAAQKCNESYQMLEESGDGRDDQYYGTGHESKVARACTFVMNDDGEDGTCEPSAFPCFGSIKENFVSFSDACTKSSQPREHYSGGVGGNAVRCHTAKSTDPESDHFGRPFNVSCVVMDDSESENIEKKEKATAQEECTRSCESSFEVKANHHAVACSVGEGGVCSADDANKCMKMNFPLIDADVSPITLPEPHWQDCINGRAGCEHCLRRPGMNVAKCVEEGKNKDPPWDCCGADFEDSYVYESQRDSRRQMIIDAQESSLENGVTSAITENCGKSFETPEGYAVACHAESGQNTCDGPERNKCKGGYDYLGNMYGKQRDMYEEHTTGPFSWGSKFRAKSILEEINELQDGLRHGGRYHPNCGSEDPCFADNVARGDDDEAHNCLSGCQMDADGDGEIDADYRGFSMTASEHLLGKPHLADPGTYSPRWDWESERTEHEFREECEKGPHYVCSGTDLSPPDATLPTTEEGRLELIAARASLACRCCENSVHLGEQTADGEPTFMIQGQIISPIRGEGDCEDLFGIHDENWVSSQQISIDLGSWDEQVAWFEGIMIPALHTR